MSSINCCGSICEKCGCYKNICKGCNESNGKVFFCQNDTACPIYDCCVNNHKFKSCAKCSEVPCSLWKETRDPKFSDDEFEQNIIDRINNLQGS